jgi:hypothetical protein
LMMSHMAGGSAGGSGAAWTAGWSALKSGLLGASASGAVLAPGLGVFGGFGAAGRTVPMGAICATTGLAVTSASAPVISNVRKLRDIELNLFISNENPSPFRLLQRLLAARQSPGRHSRRKSQARTPLSQTNH